MKFWAVVPVKALAAAKQRLSGTLGQAMRRDLALAMLEDVLLCLAAVPRLDGIIVATIDDGAAALARRCGAAISREKAGDGHSEAVAAVANRLARGGAAMLALPADIPLVRPADIARLIAAGELAPAFAIVPARTGAARTRCCARPRTRCRCASAARAFRRISRRRGPRGLRRRCCNCRASPSISTMATISPPSSPFRRLRAHGR